MSAELTLGAGAELHLSDLESWTVSARTPRLLSRLPPEHGWAELHPTALEELARPKMWPQQDGAG